MSLEKIMQAKHKTVGTKQTMRLVESGKASLVFVARDADPRLTGKIVNLCKKSGVKVTWVDSMKQLGKACGIEVGAAMAATAQE
jgi:large subunit ribosomal protein L7A